MKKTRDITVNGNEYVWLVKEVFFPEHKLNVWVKGKKGKPYIEMVTDHLDIITPKNVAETIELANTMIEPDHEGYKTVMLSWDRENQKAVKMEK